MTKMTLELNKPAPPSILLVEDDPVIAATLRIPLTAAGFRCSDAASAEQALKMIASNPPDLAVLDQRLPGMSGIELAHILRDQHHIPFVFLTAFAEDALVADAIETGAMSFLIKPVDPKRLLPVLRAALRRSAELNDLRRSAVALRDVAEANQIISTAVGLIMERFNMSKATAFNTLRGHARSERKKLVDVSRELLVAYDSVNTRLEGIFPKEPPSTRA